MLLSPVPFSPPSPVIPTILLYFAGCSLLVQLPLLTSGRVTEALESFLKAKDVFVYEFGFVHPRTSTVMRNLERIRCGAAEAGRRIFDSG